MLSLREERKVKKRNRELSIPMNFARRGKRYEFSIIDHRQLYHKMTLLALEKKRF